MIYLAQLVKSLMLNKEFGIKKKKDQHIDQLSLSMLIMF